MKARSLHATDLRSRTRSQIEVEAKRVIELRHQLRRQLTQRRPESLDRNWSDLFGLRL